MNRTPIKFSKLQRLLLLAMGIGMAFCLPSSAVDGIAVSMRTHTMWQAYWDTLWKYDIQNDDVVKATPLFTGKSRYPSINVAGTHVAFFNKLADGVYISIMPLAGGSVVNLCKASMGTYGCAGGILDWTVDDWIYFSNNNSWSDGNGDLYRIKYPTPGQPAVFFHCRAPIGAGALSVDGTKAFFTLGGTGLGMSKYTLTGTPVETNWCTFNCGAGLSPSGTYLLNFSGGGHNAYSMQTWNNTASCQTDLPSVTDFNDWCVNCAGFRDTCDKDWDGNPSGPSYYTVGSGASGDHNRFSVNSDKWFCSDIGMGLFARYQMCSGNQILINWVDHKTINVSKNPRSCGTNTTNYGWQCHQNEWNQWTANEGGDFIVTAPAEDILPELRQYLTSVNPQRLASPYAAKGITWQRGRTPGVEVFNVRGNRIPVTARHAGIYITVDKSTLLRATFTADAPTR